jgi:hypothetical protein
MTHEEAFRRLPDLLDDRDNAPLLEHVRGCAACQRQLFLLGRVDRALRASAPAPTRNAATTRAYAVAGALLAAAAAAILLLVFLPSGAHSHAVVLRTAAGRSVGEATIARADVHNVSLTLTAHGLPVNRGRVFVFWAADRQSTMLVGRFMADQQGNCHVRFNLPADHDWNDFWVTRPGDAHAMVATGT